MPQRVLYQPESNPYGRVGATDMVVAGQPDKPKPAVVAQSSSLAASPPQQNAEQRPLMNLVLRRQRIEEMLPSSISLSFILY